MKKLFLLLFTMLVTFSGFKTYGQTTLDSVSVFKPEKYPAYKTGLNGWTDFLVRNLDRDLPAKNGAPSGKHTVVASFLVDSVGKISDIQIEKDPGYGMADEMKRMIRLTDKKWIPASANGKPVSYRHKQSLTFVVD